ncbi:radical SAM family heme chaperone HemW [Uliginosibacterium sp. TH139]|uniref:radical SAM family heme chaperone HemW n=1 Tax=Uliginosibacterium sp. TH139 TaxID=2067453 RepID=UPI000C7CDD50|nr:radical SAM family heme chaperone HemW [Uliginosibacterium sp. TH139]PLK50461.1 oxygen-independent coproporphyrinogen III oxidase-like protein [Uliginosibacterium sp. TH139]
MSRTIPIIPRAAAALKSHAPQLSAPPPLSLYIHYPWCVRKCPYCDFNSHNVKDTGIPEQAYVDALLRDLETSLPRVWGRRVHSIFIGGGTPSLLSPEGLDRLLTTTRTLLPLEPDCEITLEANPGTVESARFAAFRAAGVTRVSVGIQSFNETHLKALGRIHDRVQAIQALEAAATHFDTWNADLMYALPQQTLAEAEADLAQALQFAPPHLSCYHLTLEPNTLFHRDPPSLPDDETSADMQEMIEAKLAEAGYNHYETSAFAQAGHKCRHNLNYWRFGDYLGIGAGAHGKLSDHLGVHRQMRHKHPNTYLERSAQDDFIQEQHTVEAHELPFEFMMNALRLTEGVPRSLFQERTGLPLDAIEDKLIGARQRGLLEITDSLIRPTERGQRFLNDLLEHFLAH